MYFTAMFANDLLCKRHYYWQPHSFISNYFMSNSNSNIWLIGPSFKNDSHFAKTLSFNIELEEIVFYNNLYFEA